MTGLKRYATYLVLHTSYLFSSCGVEQQLSRSAKETVLQQPAFKAAHAGISIYEPATGKYWFNYQGDKYFVPASNTKIPTCYAAMKYLGDSLVGLKYDIQLWENDNHTGYDTLIRFEPSGDPTFLHPDFKFQPVFDTLRNKSYKLNLYAPLYYWRYFGSGWSWSDAQESYMPPRSFFPVYGNVIRFRLNLGSISVWPSFLRKNVYVTRNKNWNVIGRLDTENIFYIDSTDLLNYNKEIPFFPREDYIKSLLEDTLKKEISYGYKPFFEKAYRAQRINNPLLIHSQPTDSLLKPMMHRSDNFFAEQSLLMVSNELLGVMNDERIIDTLLKTDFKDLPQKPRWADGSGLSRYNLFTPQAMVAILTKMKNEFGMERIKVIFPTGGEGTISSYYKQDAGFIYGKTGTLSGVVAFSGFLYTKKGKLLIFSTLINNHQGSATDIRRAIENFLQGVRSKY